VNWKNCGDEFVKNEQYEDAIECYIRAVKIDPNYSSAWNNMGFAYVKHKKIKITSFKDYENMLESMKIRYFDKLRIK
jgi:tetratricopeptide (TPR) repeat protein